MALDAASILLAMGAGTVKGIEKAQEKRDKELEKRIKTLTEGPNVELAKSKHKEAYKEYSERKNKIKPLMSIGSLEQREMQYAMDVRGMSYEEFEKAKRAGHDFKDEVTNEALQAQIGDEPIADYMTEAELASLEAPSVLRGMGATFGIGERDKSVDQQIAELRAKKQARATVKTPTRSAQVEPTATGGVDYTKSEKMPEWERKKQAEIASLQRQYPDADATQIEDLYYRKQAYQVTPSGEGFDPIQAAAADMGMSTPDALSREIAANRRLAIQNQKTEKSYSATKDRDTLASAFATDPELRYDSLDGDVKRGAFASMVTMQEQLVRGGMNKEVAQEVVLRTHGKAISENGFFMEDKFDKQKMPLAKDVLDVWKTTGYYQNPIKVLEAMYPEEAPTTAPTETPAVNTQMEQLVPADQVMTPMQELQVIHKDKIDYYRSKYPNRSVEDIIKQMQKQGII